jgi:hypothetical protein
MSSSYFPSSPISMSAQVNTTIKIVAKKHPKIWFEQASEIYGPPKFNWCCSSLYAAPVTHSGIMGCFFISKWTYNPLQFPLKTCFDDLSVLFLKLSFCIGNSKSNTTGRVGTLLNIVFH